MGRWGEGGVWRRGKREIIHIIYIVSLHCHHRNDPCIKMGSDKSHFNVSLIVREKVTNKTVSTNHNFWREMRTEVYLNWGPSAYQPNALPLGQTSSLLTVTRFCWTAFLVLLISLPEDVQQKYTFFMNLFLSLSHSLLATLSVCATPNDNLTTFVLFPGEGGIDGHS